MQQLLNLYRDLTSSVLNRGGTVADADVLGWMILLHTHSIDLRESTVAPTHSASRLPALTKRAAAEIVSSLWAKQADARSTVDYWYGRYEREVSFEFVEQVTPSFMATVTQLKERLTSDPRVRLVLPEP